MSSIISVNLKKYRQLNKFTQQEMAQQLFVTPQAISKWERGESLPDISLIPMIANLFEIEISSLWEEDLGGYEIRELVNKATNCQIEKRILTELNQIEDMTNFTFDFDFFLILTDIQKERVALQILTKAQSDLVIEDFFYFLPNPIKEKLILKLIDEHRYLALENLIPLMSKKIRTKVLEGCLLTKEYDILDELFPFLNYEQKELIILLIKVNNIPLKVFDNYLTFFTDKQREKLLAKGREE